MRSERGGFQLMQIMVLLGMYFDAVVVEVKKNFFSDWLWPYCVPSPSCREGRLMHKKRRRPENLQSFFPFLSVFAHDGGTAFICLLVQLVRNPPIQPEGKILLGWISSS